MSKSLLPFGALTVLVRPITTLADVVDWGLCTGCGACVPACTQGHIRLANIESVGIRPQIITDPCGDCRQCLSVCPGHGVDAELATGPSHSGNVGNAETGFALEIWEGYASDPQVRYRASSGGALSALAAYCLEQEDMEFVLHTGMNENQPWLNATVQSRSREELSSRAGSRYAPASPCEGLGAIESGERPCVFIGKPCDTTAAFKLRRERPALDRNLGLVLTFFCAGTPSTRGTLDLLQQFGTNQESVRQLRYRGEGWPGRFRIDHPEGQLSLSYNESWGKLNHYRPMRCQLCPDGLGRVADIACGDAWETFDSTADPGRSLIIVRTVRGREILHRAIKAGYVELVPASTDNVVAAQRNLLQKRKDLFGRLAALRMFLIPVPQFKGFSLLSSWMRLPLLRKATTLIGTIRRILVRGLWRRQPVTQSFPSVSPREPANL